MASKTKVLFVLIDGLGDVAVPALDHRTPLAAATTGFMDLVASASLPTCFPFNELG